LWTRGFGAGEKNIGENPRRKEWAFRIGKKREKGKKLYVLPPLISAWEEENIKLGNKKKQRRAGVNVGFRVGGGIVVW